jgi:hypothetical protein
MKPEGTVYLTTLRKVQSALYDFETEMLDFGLVPDAKMQLAFYRLIREWKALIEETRFTL